MKQLFTLLFLIASCTAGAQRLITSSFENGVYDSLSFIETCCLYSAVKTAKHPSSGSFSLRMEIRKSDPSVSTGGKRTEINGNSTNKILGRYNWRWYRMSVFTPSDSNATDLPGKEFVMGQFKQPSTGGVQTGGSPPFAFVVEGNNVYADIRWATAANPDNNRASNLRRYYVGSRGLDSTIHYVVDYQRSSNPDGVIRIWRNDILVVNDTGRNYFEGAGIPSTKWGIYRYVWSNANYGGSATPCNVIYLDDIGLFGLNSTYSDVAVFTEKR